MKVMSLISIAFFFCVVALVALVIVRAEMLDTDEDNDEKTY